MTEILDYYRNGQNRSLVLTVRYEDGTVPNISEEVLEAIKQLLPGKPGVVRVG